MSASIWWAGDGKRVLFTRREGWADSLTAIYEWTPNREGAPRRIVLTDDVLINCQVALNDLLCLREGSLRPRHFVKIDRSEEHTSELQSLMRISYAVFCLKKKKKKTTSQ